MKNEIKSGMILDEQCEITLDEFSQACSRDTEWVIELVSEGILEPIGNTAQHEWRFTGTSLLKAKAAIRLQRDLDINLAGVALALELIQEIEELQAHVNVLKSRA